MAKVLQINNDIIKIGFDGWSSKWDEVSENYNL